MSGNRARLPDKVQHWKPSRLVPYDRNPRTHSDAQVAKIAASIDEFGFTKPILVAEDTILAGHGALQAALLLKLPLVPVIELTHLTPTQRRAYVIADNRLALESGWDEEMLVSELAELQAQDYDLKLTGFSADELADILPAAGEPDFKPGTAAQQGRLDHRSSVVTCPKCQHEFSPK